MVLTGIHPFLLLLFLSFQTFTLADDAAVMSELLAKLSPKPTSWSATSDFCTWANVECDKNTKRVISINLGSKSLSGKLPAGLNSLSQLKTLSFQQNKLSGPLPTLANLTSLQEIYLDNNNFTQIPSDFFQGLTSLQIVSLSENINLSPWTLPSDLTQSASLVTLYASHSKVVGSIPDIFNALPNLQNLRLSYNNLTGSLPSSFAGSEIQNLWLSRNMGFRPSYSMSVKLKWVVENRVFE